MRIGFVIALLALVAAPTAAQEVTDGLIAHWPLDETFGTAVGDNHGANHGTRFGAVTGLPGLVGGAYEFDGANDGLTIANRLGNFGAGDFTISAWVRFTADQNTPGDMVIFHFYATYSGRYAGVVLAVRLKDGLNQAHIHLRDAGGTVAEVYGGADLKAPAGAGPADGWHQVVGVRAGNQTMLYVDGTLVGTDSTPLGDVTDQGARPIHWARIGATHTSTGHQSALGLTNAYYRGRIDEVKLFGRALSATEIAQEHATVQAGVVAPAEMLLAHWDLNETSGGAVSDVHSTNNGTRFGAVTGVPGVGGSTAYEFDGVDDGLSLVNNLVDFGAGNYTVAAWVNVTESQPGDRTIFHRYGTYNGRLASIYLSVFNTDGKDVARWIVRDTDGTTLDVIGTTQLLGTGWRHLVGVRNATQTSLYLDGTLEGTLTNPALGVDTSDHFARPIQYLRIGAANSQANHQTTIGLAGFFLKARIDDVKIWGRALTATEIGEEFADPGESGDTESPVVDITAPTAGAIIATTSVTVSGTIDDAGETTVTSTPAGISQTVPAGGGAFSGTVPLLVEGENLISVSATDGINDPGGTSVTVIRDTTAPGIEVLSPADGAVVGTSPVTVTVQVTDLTATAVDVAGQQFNLPAGGGTVVASVALTEGANAIAITATDAAGHTTPATVDVTLDTTAPMVTIDAPANGACFGPGDSPIAVSATIDDLTATSVSSTPTGVSDNLPAGGGIAMGAVGLQEGYNTVTVTATDAAGTPGCDFVTVVLDTTPPDVDFISPENGDAVRGTIDIAVDATDPLPGSGIDRVEVFVDGTLHTTLTEAPFEMMLDTTALADGPHALRAVAHDGKGLDRDASVSITVDNTAPSVTILAPADGAVVGGTVPFQVLVEDATSGVAAATMRAAGVAPTGDASTTYATPVASDTLNGSEDTTRWPDGPLTLTAFAVDAAGNQSAIASVNVTLDNTKPDKTIVTPSAGDVVSGTITIEATANDPHLASIEIFVDGNLVGTATSSPYSVAFDTTTRLDGPMTIRVVATDTVGNSDPCDVVVTVDNISLELKPSLLNLKAKGGGSPITATLIGPNLAPLLPTENHTIELRVPGGNAVPAEQGWDGDDALQGNDDKLKLRFSRSALSASVQAGLAGGAIPANATAVDITLVIDGFAIGTTSLGLKR
jgi:hypothetical protein